MKEFRKMKAVSKEERKIRNRIDYLEKQISAHEEKGIPGTQEDYG